MNKIILLLPAFFVVISCGENSENQSENKNETVHAEEEAVEDSITLDQIISTEDPTTVLAEYKKLRLHYIHQKYGKDTEVDIDTAMYYRDGKYAIFNFTEHWNNLEYINYAVVINAVDLNNQMIVEQDNDFGEINTFLVDHFPENTAFYRGNFEDAPPYQIVDYKCLLLTDYYHRHTYINSHSTLYFLHSQLASTPVVAHTQGYGGECEEFKGFQEKFVEGSNPYQIVVDRHEYIHGDGCDLIESFHYQKVWLAPNLLEISEDGPGADVPTFFKTDFTDDISLFPAELTQLEIDNGDTLYNDKVLKIIGSDMPGEGTTNFLEESDYFVVELELIIDFKQLNDSTFTIYSRSMGFTIDRTISDKNAWIDTEYLKEYRAIKVFLKNAQKGIYEVEFPAGRMYLYTSKKELFDQAEFETDL